MTKGPVEKSAPGKAILIGEHSVLYGAHAVAMPVTSASVHLKFALDPEHSLARKPIPKVVSKVVEDCFLLFGRTVPSDYFLEINSTLLIGAGLGSSAALSVVIVEAVAECLGCILSPAEVAEKARTLEGRFHGKSSGLDVAVVAHQRALMFQQDSGATCLEVGACEKSKFWPFVLVDSGQRARTTKMIQIAKSYFLQNRSIPQQFDQLALKVAASLKEGAVGQVASAMSAAAVFLDEAGIVSLEMKNILQRMHTLGVLAAKPTGAGGGGCLLALLDPAKIENQLKSLKNQFQDHRVITVYLDPDRG